MENDNNGLENQTPRVIDSNSTKIAKEKSKKRLLVIVGVVILIVAAAAVAFTVLKDKSPDTASNGNQNPPVTTLPGADLEVAEVNYTSDGFIPNTIRIKAGQAVKWTNDHAGLLVVASDPHPEHTDLEGLVSDTIDQDADYSFTFTEPGTYTYHNHLDPTSTGTIIVEE